jgi:hypothetical protein
MGLKDLNEELHKREGIEREDARPHQFDPGVDGAKDIPSQEAYKPQGWGEPVSFWGRHKKTMVSGLVICGILIAIAGAYFTIVKIQRAAFSSDNVKVAVDGPINVSGTESSLFVITYTNNNRSDLTDADLTLSYPDNFQPEITENMSINGSSSQIHISNISGNSQGKVELRGKFYGSKGTLAYVKGLLKYKPQSVGSYFQAESQLGITIQSPSIKLAIDAPLEVSPGGVVEYRVDYTNLSDVTFDHLRLKVEYPDGFHPQDANPKASEGDNVWYVGNLLAGQTGSIDVTGTMDGAKNEAKIFKAHMGMLQGNGELLSYSDSDRLTKVVSSPLSVQQTVNGLNKLNVNPGDGLDYVIHYKNEGQVGLRNVIITLEVDGAALDFTKLKLNGGALDDKRHIITWKAADVHDLANLAPGQEGNVSVFIPVLFNVPVKIDSDKNFIVTSIAKIDSPDVPTPTGSNKIIGSNTLLVKVNSGLDIGVSTEYEDQTIPNTGPTPPQIGQETTYTLHWKASNASNDVDKAVVMAYLPTGIRWTGKFFPLSEDLTYDARTNQIVWNIGNLPSGTGSLKSAREVMFQIGLTPQVNQSGELTPVLGATTFTAHDLFTDENLKTDQVNQRVSIARQ